MNWFRPVLSTGAVEPGASDVSSNEFSGPEDGECESEEELGR